MFLRINDAALMNLAQQVTPLVRQQKVEAHQLLIEATSIRASNSGNPSPVIAEIATVLSSSVSSVSLETLRQGVDFVQSGDDGLLGGVQLGQHLQHGGGLLFDILMRYVNYMRIRSASAISSSVARNAATSGVGSFWMKPTVSVESTSLPPGNLIRRVVGSSVANNWSATKTPTRSAR